MSRSTLLIALGFVGLGLTFGMVQSRAAMNMENMSCCKKADTAPATSTAPSSQPSTQKAVYVCPMDADVVTDHPGKCPKCGMDLIKK